MRAGKRYRNGDEAGFTYVTVLAALVIFGLGLAALGESWSAASKREREAELIEAGAALVQAIGTYYVQTPGAVKAYPQRLDELVEDRRFAGAMHHLRRIARDPVSGTPEWGLVMAADGGIQGVYSLSEKETLRRQPLQLPNAMPISGARYSDWKFIYRAAQTAPAVQAP
jgi:type II secretory pathway pseudopilin PulG